MAGVGAGLLSFIRRTAATGAATAETDAELLARFTQVRDEQAFEAVLSRHAAMVFGVCRRLLPTGQDAEEAFQATFLALARAAAARRWDPSVANWLFTTARQIALNVRRAATRRSRREQSALLPHPPGSRDPLEAVSGREFMGALDEELTRLPGRFRAPLLLCIVEGLSRDEAAARLGIPLGTLKARLERGRAVLRAALQVRGLAPAALAILVLAPPARAVAPHLLRSTLAAAMAGAADPAAISFPVLTHVKGVSMRSLRLKSTAGFFTVFALAAAAVAGGQNARDLEDAPVQRPVGKVPDVRQPAAELHVVGVYGAKGSFDGGIVDVEVRPTRGPVVLALTAYYPVTWNVRLAPGARVEKVILGGYFAQEVRGVPEGVPVVNRSYFPEDGSRRVNGWFFAYEWNSAQYREMVRRLNDLTKLPVASFQAAYEGTAFIIDAKRGRDRAQPPRVAAPKELTPAELRAAAEGAELHVVGVYGQDDASRPIEVEVKPTRRPVVLVVTAYDDVVWKVKAAPRARLRAVVASGYFPQEIDSVPRGVPVYRSGPDPSSQFGRRQGPRVKESFHAYETDTDKYREMAAALRELTGLPVATFQGASRGSAFEVDGARGRIPATADAESTAAPASRGTEDEPDDIADVPSRDLKAGGDANKRYFLIGPPKNARAPRDGYGLLVVLPGGDGGADFLPFVKRVYKNSVPEDYLVVQLVAPRWAARQPIVWPTSVNPVPKMRFSTEEFVEAVIKDVGTSYKIDRSRVFALAWSSGGPAAYAASLQEKGSLTGALVAMSVFNPKYLPPLTKAKGRAYYLYHSPDDRVCPYRMAEQAKKDLAEAGARVRLVDYKGGHGWRGDVYGEIRAGLRWLETNRK